MNGRLRILGIVLAFMGVGFLAGGGYAYIKTQEGVASLNALSAAQNVTRRESRGARGRGDLGAGGK